MREQLFFLMLIVKMKIYLQLEYRPSVELWLGFFTTRWCAFICEVAISGRRDARCEADSASRADGSIPEGRSFVFQGHLLIMPDCHIIDKTDGGCPSFFGLFVSVFVDPIGCWKSILAVDAGVIAPVKLDRRKWKYSLITENIHLLLSSAQRLDSDACAKSWLEIIPSVFICGKWNKGVISAWNASVILPSNRQWGIINTLCNEQQVEQMHS